MHDKKEYMKEWRKNNLSYMKEYQKQYYQRNKEELSKQYKKYYITNRKRISKYNNTYRKVNRTELLKRGRELFREKRQYVSNYKLSKGCAICGYNKCVKALDFHHNGDKSFNISRRISGNTSLEEMKKEMDKCTVLCKNCHAELHEEEV